MTPALLRSFVKYVQQSRSLMMQVSIECVERGKLLANLRQKYTALFQRVPLQVMKLHDDLVATRTLARRVLAELIRFRDSTANVLAQLNEIKGEGDVMDADRKVAAVRAMLLDL